MHWQKYFGLDQSAAPYLCVRLVNPVDPRQQPIHLDGKVDSGSVCSGVLQTVVDGYRRARTPLSVPTKKPAVAGAFDVDPVPRDSFYFYVKVLPVAKPAEECDYRHLEGEFANAELLYSSTDSHSGEIEMVSIPRPYALIGRNVLAKWITILHGPERRFKVFKRGCRVCVFSVSPKIEDMLRSCVPFWSP